MDALALALASTLAKLDTFNLTKIYSMDKAGLQYRTSPDHSLSSHHLEGCRQGKERLSVAICANGDGKNTLSLWIIDRLGNLAAIKTLIWTGQSYI